MTPARQTGFSLLEVLVAFAILAISLGVLMGIFSRATQTTIAGAQYSEAATIAESVLSAVGGDIPLEEGAYSGQTESGFDWDLNVQSIDVSDRYFTEPPAVPYRLVATVLWRDGERVRRLSVSSMRLGERL